MYNYDYEIMRERRADQRASKPSKEMTERQYNSVGMYGDCAWTGKTSSFENIFAAYHDYRNSQQWG